MAVFRRNAKSLCGKYAPTSQYSIENYHYNCLTYWDKVSLIT